MSISKKMREEKKAQTSGRLFRPAVNIQVTADWGRVDGEALRSTVAAVAQAGGALRLGVTRDGGAYSIGVYGDGAEPYTIYVRPNEDVEGMLMELEQAFYQRQNEAMRGGVTQSPPTAPELP